MSLYISRKMDVDVVVPPTEEVAGVDPDIQMAQGTSKAQTVSNSSPVSSEAVWSSFASFVT